jgi:signal transduction histidine kinase
VKLTLYWKMVLGFGVIVVAMLAVYAAILFSQYDVYTTVTTSVATNIVAIENAQQLRTLLFEEERQARKYLVARDAMYGRLFLNARAQSRARLDSLARVVQGRNERLEFLEFRRGHNWIGEAVRDRARSTDNASVAVADTMQILHKRLDRLIRLNQSAIARTVADVETRTASAVSGAILLLCCALVATISVAFLITRSVTRPLALLRKGTERIARGEYVHVPVHARDELGTLTEAFNTMSDRLKKTEDYKAEMMQQISHELRTPLQAMHAAYYMLAEQIAGPINERQRALLTNIRDNVDALSAFSNQFLDLTRIEEGMMEFQRQPVDLLSIITPIINNARITAMQKEITIGLAAQTLPPVPADPDKFATVLNNLLNNAVKFTPRGGNITVTLTPCDNGVRVAVKDSGIGIDADDLPKLFTKFFQAKNASKADVKGTGVGLALVKAIVDGHGGKVYASSTLGVGSTFTVELPSAVKAGGA